jgi:cytochrome c553
MLQPIAPSLLLIGLLVSGSAIAGGHQQTETAGEGLPGEAKARLCMGCHQAGDFDGFSQAIIAEAIQAVNEEQRSHPKIGELSAEEITEISAYFDAISD